MGAAKILRMPTRPAAPVVPSLKEQLLTGGYRPQFHTGERNPCPGCGRAQWHVGRQSAECAFCGTALPIAGDGRSQ